LQTKGAVSDQLFEETVHELVLRAVIAANPGAPIRLITHAENVGFDRNPLAAVASIRGEYCWPLGADDVPRPGSLSRLVAGVQRCPPVAHLLGNYARRDAVSREITNQRMIEADFDIDTATVSDFFFKPCPQPS